MEGVRCRQPRYYMASLTLSMEENEELLLRFVCSKFIEGDDSCCFGGHYGFGRRESDPQLRVRRRPEQLIDAFMSRGYFSRTLNCLIFYWLIHITTLRGRNKRNRFIVKLHSPVCTCIQYKDKKRSITKNKHPTRICYLNS